jgi:hypothetical protein
MGLTDAAEVGFACTGEDIRICELPGITAPEQISLGGYITIDDFVSLHGGRLGVEERS